MYRVLFATTHRFPPQMYGGSELSTLDLGSILQRKGSTVGVLCGLDSGDATYFMNRTKATIFRRDFPVERHQGWSIYRGWNPVMGVKTIVKEFKPDIAVLQAGHQSKMAKAFIDTGTPIIWYLRDVDFNKQISDCGGIEQMKNILGSATVIANSHFTARRFNEIFDLTAFILPPLVNLEKFRFVRESRGKFVLFVNPVKVKGVELAFGIAERRRDIPFLFIESWPLGRDRFSELAVRAQLLGNVQLRRSVDNISKIYQDTSILLMPSLLEEAWGRVVTEVQASGIPVLCSDRGGLPEAVGTGGVLLDPSQGADEWGAALADLWDNHDTYERYSAAALDHAQRREIQPDYIGDKFIDIMLSAIGPKRAHA